jgi:hypothetical protein
VIPTRDSEEPNIAAARQRWLHMRERARHRMATAPTYPDHPDDIAEQEAVTRALAPGQARARDHPMFAAPPLETPMQCWAVQNGQLCKKWALRDFLFCYLHFWQAPRAFIDKYLAGRGNR